MCRRLCFNFFELFHDGVGEVARRRRAELGVELRELFDEHQRSDLHLLHGIFASAV